MVKQILKISISFHVAMPKVECVTELTKLVNILKREGGAMITEYKHR